LALIAHALLSGRQRARPAVARDARIAAARRHAGPNLAHAMEAAFHAYGPPRHGSPPSMKTRTTRCPRRAAAPRRACRRAGRSNGYVLPSLKPLLTAQRGSPNAPTLFEDLIDANAVALESVLGDFGLRGEIINARPGPVVTLYELEPRPASSRRASSVWADDIGPLDERVIVRPRRGVSGRKRHRHRLPNPTR